MDGTFLNQLLIDREVKDVVNFNSLGCNGHGIVGVEEYI